eukprot:XP_001706082.1 Hypothetical protein GL50803_36072 [Giardia lamblia ATCC 50803]
MSTAWWSTLWYFRRRLCSICRHSFYSLIHLNDTTVLKDICCRWSC